MQQTLQTRESIPVPMPKVSQAARRGQKNEVRQRPERSDTSRPVKLHETVVQHGHNGPQKPCFSLSGARVDNTNILYFGVHGDVTKLSLSDSDIDTLMDVLEALKDAGS